MVYGYQRLKVQKELEIGNTDMPDIQLTLKKWVLMHAKIII